MMTLSRRTVEKGRALRRIFAVRGFTLLELLFVIVIISVGLAVAIPVVITTLHSYSINNDARAVANQLSVARMRGTSTFSRVRVYCDPTLSTPQCKIQLQTYSGTPCPSNPSWTDEGTKFGIAPGDSFAIAPGASSGVGGQSGTPLQPPNASSPYTANVAPYAIQFNSRGTPIDPSTCNLKSDYALYLKSGGSYMAVGVDASGRATVYRYSSSNSAYTQVQD